LDLIVYFKIINIFGFLCENIDFPGEKNMLNSICNYLFS